MTAPRPASAPGRDAAAPRLDRSVVRGCRREEAEAEDRTYWLRRSPEERWAAVEWFRQLNYDYDPSAGRLQRVLEVVKPARR